MLLPAVTQYKQSRLKQPESENFLFVLADIFHASFAPKGSSNFTQNSTHAIVITFETTGVTTAAEKNINGKVCLKFQLLLILGFISELRERHHQSRAVVSGGWCNNGLIIRRIAVRSLLPPSLIFFFQSRPS